jgi:pyruvate,water dikinase
MTQAGLPVPPGFALTTEFFRPWLEHVQASREWAKVLGSSGDRLREACSAVKAQADQLTMDAGQQAVLREALQSTDRMRLFAVRSSSPEEDLEELSFAGGYETVLGVTSDGIEAAVRRSFVSCLDERVIAYKREHGLDVGRPRIAVIAQEQVASDSAGVAFSLNPLNNCYDEAVINANYGLGESVVSGAVSPDTWVVDKVRQSILDRKTGKKETSVWLKPDGGTSRAPSPERERLSLTDEQVLALTDMVGRVEDHFGKPMDLEWAFADGKLYLLQARPITAYVPLPDSLQTPPGSPKNLYLDMTLTKWGMGKPMSVLGTDFIARENVGIIRMTMGRISEEAVNLLRPIVGGRAYTNVSVTMKMQGKKRVAAEFRAMDALAARTLETLDVSEYIPESTPPVLKGLVFSAVRQNVGLVRHLLNAVRRPEESAGQYLASVRQLRAHLPAIARETTSFRELADRLAGRMLEDTPKFLSVIFAAEIARSKIRSLFKNDAPEVRERVSYLERGLPNNVTIEMGLAMDRLADHEEIKAFKSGGEFEVKLKAKELSSEFLRAWDAFMEEFGFRCPMEMDPATPRPYEQPAEFFEQLRAMSETRGGAVDSLAAYEGVKAERERAYQALFHTASQKGPGKARQFKKNYDALLALAGLRETPKYCAILVTDMFRRRVLEAGRLLVDAGRLEEPDQVFDLTMADLDKAFSDRTLDLRERAHVNSRFHKRLEQVREFPRLIDSRGKILRPVRERAGDGELWGEPISTGVVRGPANVLLSAGEKPVFPGDILVAQATDPGWTPLFINAAGVILEVGGLLQHGALVAREYGKPCVAGIEGVTALLKDGQMVEVDGTHGVVRMV